ncbi:dimethyl sulfoxide reductase anchor subunit [Halovulum dunhuangense]|uniref:Dimethyl sulfoxide reductase anchor subunit n=1 Tax=Halovulum dunhuangense TaxID=1505036 RepID=A0A849L0S8_9RHOB|nr:DmsC/YnfH family molybdoenzyme membrane anchor subunit [Halovulum dunhuangense]NNU79839.1 dimethyl sulfoxide reductase anchor subunit [Halovulum dunhuangense]
MHPAPSLIVFTTLSGLGFGLMVWLGIDPPEKGGWVMAVFALLALALAGIGLLASLWHLGHPERAWRALSQWRSSWLSREGVAAIVTIGVFTLYSGIIVLQGQPAPLLGGLAALLALVTIGCTAMIYAQLRSVPRWHDPLTPLLFLLYGLAGGGLLAGKITASAWLLVALGIAQVAAWTRGDKALAQSGSTMETATGLGHLGKVRLLEAPHTGGNYLLKEMAFRVGRKHAAKLRMIALGLAVVFPAAAGLMTDPKHLLGGLMVIAHLTGVLTARWLFYAEAEHVVGLYYGKR